MTGDSGLSFAELIAPIGVERFFAEFLGRQWLHIPGTPARAERAFSWASLNAILNMDAWTPSTFTMHLDRQQVPPPAFCAQTVNRNRQGVLRPVPERVRQLLDGGASLVLNDVASLSPDAGAVVAALRRTFNARAEANVYYSSRQRQAFDSHCDRHDVYALQIAGEKRWRVYRGRADNPVEHPRFQNVPQAEYDRLKGEVDAEVTMAPGDVLYLPRGQFHDALAASAETLHLTFSCVRPTGLHLIEDMLQRMVEEPAFRADLPAPDGAGGEAALAARLEDLLARLTRAYSGAEGLQRVTQAMRGLGAVAPPFELPRAGPEAGFRVRPGWRLLRRGQAHLLSGPEGNLPLAAAERAPVAWMLEREAFQRDELEARFGAAAAGALGRLVELGAVGADQGR